MKAETIQNHADLQDCLEHLNASKRIAVDLEFDKNRYRYGFNLCLMQVATDERCFLFDPFVKDVVLDPVYRLFERDDQDMVVYSFGEDLRLLHSLGCFPKKMIDLNIAVLLLNFPKTGLGTVLEDMLHVKLSASAQKSNWFQRPLTENQLKYACEDVIHLFELQTELEQLALRTGVQSWIEEENSCFNTLKHTGNGQSEFIKDKYMKDLNAVQWFVLKKLLHMREDIAAKINRPSFQVIDPKNLIEITQNPNGLKQWTELKGVHRNLRNNNFKNSITRLMEQAEQEALNMGLSKSEPAKEKMSREEWQEMKRRKIHKENIHKSKFKPIQLWMAEKYGEFAAPHILGNRLVGQLIDGDKEGLRKYKLDLLKQASKELNIDIEEYL